MTAVSCALMASTCKMTSMCGLIGEDPTFIVIESQNIAVFTVANNEARSYLVGSRYHINNIIWFLIKRCARSPPKIFLKYN